MKGKISRLIGRLTVARKLALIYFLDLTAVIFVSGILINEKFIAIDFANKEIAGNQYITVVREALLSIAAPSDRERATSGDGQQSTIRRSMAQSIAKTEDRFDDMLQTRELSGDFVQALLRPDADPPSEKTFEIGRALLTRIGNQSNLILDPALDSYYTMSLVVLRFPETLELLGNVRRLALHLSAMPTESRHIKQTQFLILEGRLDAVVRGIGSDYSEAFAASSPMLRNNLQYSHDALQKALERFRSASNTFAGLTPDSIERGEFAAREAAAIETLQEAWIAAQSELDRLLRARIDNAYSRMWMHLGTAVMLLLIILSLVYFVAKQIAVPIRDLAKVAHNVRRSGNYTLRASWDSEDEIGHLVAGFNSMLGQLDYQRIAQQELIARASAAEAQRMLVDAVPIPLIVTAIPDHQVLHANHAAQAWLNGHDKDPWLTGMEPASRIRFFQGLSDVGTVDEFEVRWMGGLSPTWALVSARRLEYHGTPAVLTTFTPIGQIKQLESRLEMWAKVFEASSEGIVVMDANGCIITVNRAFCRSTSFEFSELVGRSPTSLLSEQNDSDLFATLRQTATATGSWQGEVWINRKNNESYPAWMVVNAVRNSQGSITHFIAISLDISERKASEQRIHYLAHHDVLTGLPNRFLCEERLQLSIQQAHKTSGRVAVLFVDLDRFKSINDSLGHHVGDGLLRSVAERLKKATREGDTVSRLGGDEFVVILNNISGAGEVRKIVDRRLVPSIRQVHVVDGSELYVSCSIGIAVFPDDGKDIDELMRNADVAMYEAKKVGRNDAQFFKQELNERVVRHLHIESDLRHAVERNELVLHYQPRVTARDGRIAGVESLVRWQHPSEGLMLPGQFIPIAEESGLIVPIGAWILREACRQHCEWRDRGLGLIPISINLSGVQLKEGRLVETLKEVLASYPVDAGQMELELTESILMDNVPATIKTLEEIKALGFALSVDDFGSGYSSLSYLCRFPLDRLKIDRSFVANIHSAPQNLAVTKAIIGLGHTLGLGVVAEGVEHESDVRLLKNAGCDELQGFYIARPMAAEQFEDWIPDLRLKLA